MNCIDLLVERVAHGWRKLNEDGSHIVAGAPPFFDLYGAVQSLQSLQAEYDRSTIFQLIASTVIDLYPERVRTEMLWPYDDRIVLFEFNDHPLTTRADVLNVLIARRTGRGYLSRRMSLLQ